MNFLAPNRIGRIYRRVTGIPTHSMGKFHSNFIQISFKFKKNSVGKFKESCHVFMKFCPEYVVHPERDCDPSNKDFVLTTITNRRWRYCMSVCSKNKKCTHIRTTASGKQCELLKKCTKLKPRPETNIIEKQVEPVIPSKTSEYNWK